MALVVLISYSRYLAIFCCKELIVTRQHSSWMCTARLPTVRVLVATTRCQSREAVGIPIPYPPGYTNT